MRITADLLKVRLPEIVGRISSDQMTGGDQTRIEIAISGFVRANFYPRYPGSSAPRVSNLSQLVRAAIEQFTRSNPTTDAALDELCPQLAEFINSQFQKKENKPWRKVGRGWN